MARFAKDFGALPHFVSTTQMKSIFRAANLGSNADERRGSLNESEFGSAVRRLIATVKDRMVDGATTMPTDHPRLVRVQGLLNLDAGNVPRSSRSHIAGLTPKKPRTASPPRKAGDTQAYSSPRTAGDTQAYCRHNKAAEDNRRGREYSNISVLKHVFSQEVKDRWR